MKYLAIFCPSLFQDPQGGPRYPIAGEEGALKNKQTRVSGCRMLDDIWKNLLFITLGSLITNDFVWKSKAGNPLIHFRFLSICKIFAIRQSALLLVIFQNMVVHVWQTD